MRPLGLLVLLALATAACATRAVPQPFPEPAGEAPAARAREAEHVARGHRLVAAALALRGVPYRNGGADPTGFDCSGLVTWVFGQEGVAVPRQTGAQFAAGIAVDRGDIRAGDLLFFTTVAPGASHVAIALDGDEFVHAPSSRGVVRVERLSLPYWQSRFVGARRVE
jgi:cell wall-associated NlpC family hydrolase